ncbi:MAG: hypothetical protein MUO28_04290, partial [Desulfobacterales bacterium]|nr:hypothetical protein [Desulfobacterales bacterium]
MRELGRQKRLFFYRRFLHQVLNVLVEDRREKGSGRWRGLSRNYIPVHLSDGDDLNPANQEQRVVVTEWSDKGVIGKVAEGLHG